MPYLTLFHLALPEIIVVVTALVVLGLGLRPKNTAATCTAVTAAGLLFAAAAVLMLPERASISHEMLVVSPLTSLFKVICLLLAFFTTIVAGETKIANRGEYLALLLLATIGLMLLVGSEELLMLFIGLELTGLSLYVMAGFDKGDSLSAEAGLKYFLFGGTASAFTLFGLSLVYGMCGTTSLGSIAQQLSARTMQPLLAAGIVMTLIGFAFKIAAAPFHLWAPDAYRGSPVPSGAFIASGSKVASFVALGKIVLVGFGPAHGSAGWHGFVAGWAPILAALAALSIVIGNLVALAQSNVRRLLAYSAVAHAGYSLLGLIAGGRDGFAATLFYITIYAVTLLGAFTVVALVRRETGGDEISHFSALWSRSPFLAACMAIFMLSLAGLPPLAGFFGKFYLFSATLHANENQGLLWLVALGLIGSFVSLYYYLAVLKAIFVTEPTRGLTREGNSALIRIDFPQRFALSTLAGLVLFLGLWPASLVNQIALALR